MAMVSHIPLTTLTIKRNLVPSFTLHDDTLATHALDILGTFQCRTVDTFTLGRASTARVQCSLSVDALENGSFGFCVERASGELLGTDASFDLG